MVCDLGVWCVVFGVYIVCLLGVPESCVLYIYICYINVKWYKYVAQKITVLMGIFFQFLLYLTVCLCVSDISIVGIHKE